MLESKFSFLFTSSNANSVIFLSVISLAIFEAPTMMPFWSRTAEMVDEISIVLPSFLRFVFS